MADRAIRSAAKAERPEPGSLLIFDFGGTLDADGLSWTKRFYTAYRSAGGSLAHDHFDALFTEAEINLGKADGIRSAGFRQTVDGMALFLGLMLPDSTAPMLARMADAVWRDAIAVTRRNRALLKK